MTKCKKCNKPICKVSTYCKSCYATLFNKRSKKHLDKKIISLYKDGKLSPTQIMDRLDISRCKFYMVMKEYNVPLINKRKPFSEEYKRKASIRMIKWLKDNPQHRIQNFFDGKNEKHPNWKGNKVGRVALHNWVRRYKPKLCVKYKEKEPYDIANISQEYKRDLNDFEWLCRSCHMKSDVRMNNLKYQGV